MREQYYGRVCFKSVKTIRGSPFLAVKKASASGLGPFPQLRMESSSGLILYIIAVLRLQHVSDCERKFPGLGPQNRFSEEIVRTNFIQFIYRHPTRMWGTE